jgi:hypothetical protein
MKSKLGLDDPARLMDAQRKRCLFKRSNHHPAPHTPKITTALGSPRLV